MFTDAKQEGMFDQNPRNVGGWWTKWRTLSVKEQCGRGTFCGLAWLLITATGGFAPESLSGAT